MLTKEQASKIKKTVNKETDKFAIIFIALGDAGRLRMFKLLIEHNELCVTDVANILDMSVPAISQQLRVLEMSGLIRKERMAQMVCYEVKNDDPFVKSIVKLLIT